MPLLLLSGAALAAPFDHLPPMFRPEVSITDPVSAPQIRVTDDQPLLTALELSESDVVVEAYAGIARITLQHWFDAAEAPAGDAAYLLPLPDGAVVDHAELRCGDRRLDSMVVPRQPDARLREGKPLDRFALLDDQPGEVFSWELGALCDGPIAVTVQYTVALPYDGEHFTLSLPASAPLAPRLPWLTAPAPPPQEVTVYTDDGMPLATVESGDSAALNVSLCGGQPVTRLTDDGADGVWLSWSLSGVATTQHRPDAGAPGTLALTIPPEVLGELPAPTPRELLFVLDRSCSMAGEPYALARGVVHDTLAALPPGDTFNLYRLHQDTPLFSAPQPSTPATRAAAARWLEGSAGEAGGPLAGLHSALHSPARPGARMLPLLTDGHLDPDVLARALDGALGGSRIYPIGLGGYADRALLDHIATQSRGAALYPPPGAAGDQLSQQLSALLAPPTLSDITIDWGGLHVLDQQPARPLDISAHRPLRVLARYADAPAGPLTVRVHGQLDGAPIVLEVPLSLDAVEPHHEGLTSAWASQRIAAIALGGHAPPQARAAIVDLAVEHGLVTRYTSLVSVDDATLTPVIDARPVPEAVPVALAALDWSSAPPAPPPRKPLPAPIVPPVVVHAAPPEAPVTLAWTRAEPPPNVAPQKVYLSTVGMNIPTGEAADRIRRLVDTRQDEIGACYRERLEAAPELSGTVAVDVEVQEGKIVSLVLSENTTGDDVLADCTLARLGAWPYPATVSGRLHLPFKLSTTRF